MSKQTSDDSNQTGLLFRLIQRGFLFLARIRRGMTLGVRAMVLNDRDQILLVRHSYVRGWHMPGGGVEAGETLEEALVKELREEANIELDGEARLHGVFLNPAGAGRDHITVYIVRHFIQTAPKVADREILEACFFPLDALPPDTTQATQRRLAEALQGKALSSAW